MRAVVFEDYKTFPVLKDVPQPSPGHGEVLLKVAGCGACHSDVAFYDEFEPSTPGSVKPPFTLGHEVAGWVEEVGAGVEGFEKGAAYVVYGPIGCGHCAPCIRGEDTYCVNADPEHPFYGIGVERDGGMAEYVTVPARNLVPLGDADPVDAAALADAGMTSYHAIKMALPALNAGGTFALVMGLGGLGQIAVQILGALTGATIIATDMKAEAREKAEAHGAITVASGADQVAEIRRITGGRGVDAAFDFVGIEATITACMQAMAQGGRLVVAGLGGGAYSWNYYTTPFEATITNTYWGNLSDLREVVAMYQRGQIVPDTTHFGLDQALDAYRLLEDGKVTGRAVIVPQRG